MTTATIALPNAARYSSTAAFGSYAHVVSRQKKEASQHILASETGGGRLRRHLLSELDEIGQECSGADWDGYHALPVKSRTVLLAKALVRMLPFDLQYPSPGAEPDGHVALEWYCSPDRVLSVSIGPAGDLHWAVMIDGQGDHGKSFLSDQLPMELLYLIKRVMEG